MHAINSTILVSSYIPKNERVYRLKILPVFSKRSSSKNREKRRWYTWGYILKEIDSVPREYYLPLLATGMWETRPWFRTISLVQVEFIIALKRGGIQINRIVIHLCSRLRIVIYLFQGNVNQLVNQVIYSSSTLCRYIHMNQSISLYKNCLCQAWVYNTSSMITTILLHYVERSKSR